MKIRDPQSATLTNIEVLAHLTTNPPRRSTNPLNSTNFTPKPDLRDHNTVVKEIHNYVSRVSPHLYNLPKYTHETSQPEEIAAAPSSSQPNENSQNGDEIQPPKQQDDEHYQLPQLQPTDPTDLDKALREVIVGLKPFGLTKAEVMMIINLGAGAGGGASVARGEENEETENANGGKVDGEGDVAMAAGNGADTPGEDGQGEGEVGEGGEEDDFGDRVLLDTIIEDREERLADEHIREILRILREAWGRKGRREGENEEGVGL